MTLRLRDGLHWCRCSGRIVFLDVAADRYFCLPSIANDPFMKVASGSADRRDTERLAMLTKGGILADTEGFDPFPQPAAIGVPTRDILGKLEPRSGLLWMLRALVRELLAGWQLRTLGFAAVVARAGRQGAHRVSRASRDDHRAMSSIAAAADAVALITRSHNRCLVRALAVHSACRARGIRAKFVIGVIAHPFSAHSWVQLDEAVLVGGYEQARLHTPILVVE